VKLAPGGGPKCYGQDGHRIWKKISGLGKKKNLILKHVEGTQNGEIWISVIFWFLNVPQ
jgi:hypothetical protein